MKSGRLMAEVNNRKHKLQAKTNFYSRFMNKTSFKKSNRNPNQVSSRRAESRFSPRSHVLDDIFKRARLSLFNSLYLTFSNFFLMKNQQLPQLPQLPPQLPQRPGYPKPLPNLEGNPQKINNMMVSLILSLKPSVKTENKESVTVP